MWYGASLDKQLYLSHKPQSCILLCIARSVVVEFTDTADILDNDTIDLVLTFGWTYGVCPYLVFLACKVTELTDDNGLAYEVEEFILVIDILILLLDAEYRCLARTVAGSEQHMTSECWERLSAMEIPFTLYFLIPILMIDAIAPAGHIDRIVIEQLKLTV